jgi:DNA ligase (NAD+)
MARADELEQLIAHHNQAYWDRAAPEISDVEYDLLVRELASLRPESKVLSGMGPTARFGKPVRHREPMLSLDKCYSPEGLADWLSDFEGDVTVTPKLDGIACSLRYENGKLRLAATRGDGLEGDDITQNAHGIADIPKAIPQTESLEVRGEVFMKLSVFQRFKEEGMANPRNLAAGAIKQKDKEKSAAYNLSFAAYDLIGGNHQTQAEKFADLKRMGFPEIDTVVLSQAEALRGYESLAERRASLDYEIDGVVYRVNLIREQKRLGLTSHHPRYALAYKFQGDSGTSTLEQVEWSVSRTGVITPVAIVAPVALSGVTVTRASLHNVEFINRLGLTLGARVVMVRRGGVIPNVEFVSEPGTVAVEIPTTCPSCGSKTHRERDFLFCTSPRTCKAAVLGQLAHYTYVTDMLGFGEAILQSLYQQGHLKQLGDFYRLQASQIENLERSGKKTALKLLKEIEKAKTLPLAVFLRALGITDLGKTVSQLLADRYGALDGVLAATYEELAETHGIGDVTARNVLSGLSEAKAVIADLRQFLTLTHVREGTVEAGSTDGPLAGQSFIFTGKMVAFARSEAEKKVRSRGGVVASTVNKSLNFLVVGADKTGGPSSKQKTAEKLMKDGAPIHVLTEDEFLAMVAT